MQGKGVVTDDRGRKHMVEYELAVYQEEISAGRDEPPIAGMKELRGRILPVVSFGSDGTLEMADGRKLRFFHSDGSGAIELSEWIG